MNIVLPKTLAEPWTIPWFIRNDDSLVMQIIEAVHEFFHLSEQSNQIPTGDWSAWGESQFSVAELLDCLEVVAFEAGAETATAREIGITLGDEFFGKQLTHNSWETAGFSYHITFTVPHDSRPHATSIDHWFDPDRSTRYGER